MLRLEKLDNSRPEQPKIAYTTDFGEFLLGTAEQILTSPFGHRFAGQVDLIFTSPPFPLNNKKKYGNLTGEQYLTWFKGFAEPFRAVLKKKGSIVIELGNAWEPGRPVMSTLALRALLAFLEAGQFQLIQQFVWHNPARLPSPAQWVNVERIRVKDAFTHLWWISATERPYADNRQILVEYSDSMQKLLRRQSYNTGQRPSEHHIGQTSFLTDNSGAIPSNVITLSNTESSSEYLKFCRKHSIRPHPARMPPGLVRFFIKFLTKVDSLILDPFGGSNTTGAAAEALGRRWIAIEPNDLYAEGSKGRFPQFTRVKKFTS